MVKPKPWIYSIDLGPSIKRPVAVSVYLCPHCGISHIVLAGNTPVLPICWACSQPTLSPGTDQAAADVDEEIKANQRKQRKSEEVRRLSKIECIRNTSMDMLTFADMHSGADRRLEGLHNR